MDLIEICDIFGISTFDTITQKFSNWFQLAAASPVAHSAALAYFRVGSRCYTVSQDSMQGFVWFVVLILGNLSNFYCF